MGPRNDAIRRRLLFMADVLCLLIAIGASALVEGSTDPLWALVVSPLWAVLAKVEGLYDTDHPKIWHRTSDEATDIFHWVTLSVAGTLFFIRALPDETVTVPGAATMYLAALISAFALRSAARAVWRKTVPPERALVLGTGELADAVARKLALEPGHHLALVDAAEVDRPTNGHGRGQISLEGLSKEDLEYLIGETDIERVIIAAPELDERTLTRVVYASRAAGVKLSVLPPMRAMLGTAVRLSHIAEMPVIEYGTWDTPRSTMAVKRMFDFVTSAIALILLAPLMLAIAVIVRLDSRGPALFRQLRAGREGRPFRILKFRTMCHDAEERISEVISPDDLAEPMYKLRSDPRVTRVGRFLRKTSLDELPQLFNVLRGDMSLVGPRPEEVWLVQALRRDRALPAGDAPGDHRADAGPRARRADLPGAPGRGTRVRRELPLRERRAHPDAYGLDDLPRPRRLLGAAWTLGLDTRRNFAGRAEGPAAEVRLIVHRPPLLVVSLLVLAVAGCQPGTPGPGPGPGPEPEPPTDPQLYPDKPLVPAKSSRAFGDSVGVNAHILWSDSSYAHFDTIVARMKELGVRYLRDGLCATCEHHVDRLQRLGAAGIKSHIIAGDLRDGSAEMQENLAVLRTRLKDAVASFGAPNEPDMVGDPDWVANTRAYQRELWTRVKGDPSSGLPVLGPAVARDGSEAALGDLSDYLDRGNIHPYPGGGTPLHNIASERADASRCPAPSRSWPPRSATTPTWSRTSGHHPTSERAIGYYTPRTALEGFRNGVERSYIYQLLDPWSPTEADARGFSKMENSFGLLRWDLSRKPGFLGLRNLLDAVGGDSAPVPSPGGLRYGLEGAGPDVRQLLLRSSDGRFSLVVWREVSVWDRFARRDIDPGTDSLDVVLGERVAVARRFDPVESEAERQSWTEPRRISIAVGGGRSVLRLSK